MFSFRKTHINVFALVALAAFVSFIFRAANIATFRSVPPEKIGVISTAAAVEQAPGEEPPPMESAVSAMEKMEGKPDAQRPLAPPPDAALQTRAFTTAEIEVLQSLSQRREELNVREQRLSEREALLSAAEQEVDQKISELKTLRDAIEKLLGQQQTMEEGRLMSLVKIYEGMKPKEAATIFNTLDMDVLLAVIGRMSERKSSPVLASMDPDRARVVTLRLAEQKKLPAVPLKQDKAQ